MMNLLSSTFLKPTLTMRTLTFTITQPVMKLMSATSLVLKFLWHFLMLVLKWLNVWQFLMLVLKLLNLWRFVMVLKWLNVWRFPMLVLKLLNL